MYFKLVCGLSVGLIPFATHSYGFLIFLCVLFGLTFASSFSFTPIILVRLVDLDDFTLAYGLILLVQGIGSLVGPPLAGAIFDFTNRLVLSLNHILTLFSLLFIKDGTTLSMRAEFSSRSVVS